MRRFLYRDTVDEDKATVRQQERAVIWSKSEEVEMKWSLKPVTSNLSLQPLDSSNWTVFLVQRLFYVASVLNST